MLGWGDLWLNAHGGVHIISVFFFLLSIWLWWVLLDKGITLWRVLRLHEGFERGFWDCVSLEDYYEATKEQASYPTKDLFMLGMHEYRLIIESDLRAHGEGWHGYLSKLMGIELNRLFFSLDKRIGWLATCASASPSLGLLAGLWRMLEAFREEKSLQAVGFESQWAEVALMEALMVMVMGLGLGLMALLGYNGVASVLRHLYGRLENFIEHLSMMLARRLNDKK